MKPLLLTILLPLSALASDYTLGINVGTVHNTPDRLNGANPGAYIVSPSGATAGVFYNSFNRVSVQASQAFCTDSGTWCVNVGAVTGYRKWAVMPMVLPSVRVPVGGVSLRFAVLPQIGFTSRRTAGIGGVHLSVEMPL